VVGGGNPLGVVLGGRDLNVLGGRFGLDTPSDLWVAIPTTILDPEDEGNMILANIRNHLLITHCRVTDDRILSNLLRRPQILQI